MSTKIGTPRNEGPPVLQLRPAQCDLLVRAVDLLRLHLARTSELDEELVGVRNLRRALVVLKDEVLSWEREHGFNEHEDDVPY